MNKIIVTNLPLWISEIHLKRVFERCGKVCQAQIMLDRKFPRTLGYGYVTFAHEDAMQKALALHQSKIDGNEISVQLAEEHLLEKVK